ncbi:VOC family protein [Nocardioides sp. DS6]|uniref:VOC family protein n=1 Tax=Nocardioides eburneus TaxID=3231482 RepID=A0ABV3SY14_9ACTN
MPRFESYAQGTPCYVELITHDLARAKEFYAGLFGWAYDAPPGHEDAYASARLAGDRVAGLSAPYAEDAKVPHWGVFLAVDDIDAAVAKVEPAGGTVLAAPSDVMTLGRMATIADPTGCRVHLWQAGDIPGAERATEPGALIWNELVTSDVRAATAFYTAVLGVGWEESEMGDGAPYTLLKVADRPVGGAMTPMSPDQPTGWNLYFNVEDVDTALAKAQELGATVVAPAMDLPDGMGRLGFLADPEGAMLSLMAG